MSETGGAAPSGAYEALKGHLRETAVLRSARSLLAWDQETMMPAAGGPLRAEQLATLSGLIHQRETDPSVDGWIGECEVDRGLLADPATAANLREIRRLHDRATRLPEALVREMAQTFSLAVDAWKQAREADAFPAFAPWLQKVVDLNRARAACFTSESGAAQYDALLEEYEPGARSEEVDRTFAAVRERLVPLIRAIAEAPRRPDPAPHRLRVPIPLQEAFNRRVAERLGYDLESGRIDTSVHPFCRGIGPGDTRITTRYTDDRFGDALSSTIHEVGHALYEQGLPKAEHWGQPLGSSVSLAIHESQSRLWENHVGRSRAFWEWAAPELRSTFDRSAAGLRVDAMYGAVNLVEPSLIRADADEATYHLHVMLRFDLEREMLRGDLAVGELPGAWNERMRADLGIEVPDDRRGCLQDVHWAMGAIGYFPTYTLGSLHAAQLWEKARSDIPDLDEGHASGRFGALLGWLRERVHAHGMRYRADELCERVTGSPLRPEPMLVHLESKLAPLYGLDP